ncbi:MAG: glucose 1-dehydrogenase [Chloroflexi bacterium]|nr:glucose 1-dehydrogenase [Chloroflexota bacterium]
MGKLDGKVALITGAASGIGRATAVLFAREGARVAVADLIPTGGQETVKIIKDAGGEAMFIQADVSRAAEAEKMVKTAVDTYGRIDILHNNAGIQGPFFPTADLPEEDWDKVINTDLKSAFLCSKYAIPVMQKQGGGVIVNTSSTAGVLGLPYVPAYCAAKGGIVQLTKSLALELIAQNIRVNCICPGGTFTPMMEGWMPPEGPEREAFIQNMPGGRPIQPEEIARAVLFLACDDSSAAVGTILAVDLGHSAA